MTRQSKQKYFTIVRDALLEAGRSRPLTTSAPAGSEAGTAADEEWDDESRKLEAVAMAMTRHRRNSAPPDLLTRLELFDGLPKENAK